MNRIEVVQQHLKTWGVDLLLVDSPVDLYYLTGQDLSAGRLVIEEAQATLFCDGRYFEACKAALSIPVELLAADRAMPSFPGKRIGFDAASTSYDAFMKIKELQGEPLPLSNPLTLIRAVKEAEEIEFLRQAAKLGSQGFDYLCSRIREGVAEAELGAELEIFWKKAGGQRVAFSPQISFGENSAYPHHHPGGRILKRGDLVLIDIGVVLNNYHSDMTRVLFFGTPDPELEAIYRIVHEAQLAALALCKPGTPLADLDGAARGLIEEKGYGEFFLHSLGHGVGLEIHEAPTLRKTTEGVLREGMVITVEPGIYLAGKGGVRLEDTVAITSTGYENLTNRPIAASPLAG